MHARVPACMRPLPCSISVTFIDKEDKEHTVQAPIGKNLLEVAHDNEIDLEGERSGSAGCAQEVEETHPSIRAAHAATTNPQCTQGHARRPWPAPRVT